MLNPEPRTLNPRLSDVTRILSAIDHGDPAAAEQLLPLVYHELRKLAAAKLAQEKPGQTLNATALDHEAYLRLVGPSPAREGEAPAEPASNTPATSHRPRATSSFSSRGHFFAAAAEAMRRIIIERARAKGSLKRGARSQRLELDDLSLSTDERADELLALDEALRLLEQHDPQAAALVKLRYFAGLSHRESAAALGITRRAADRLWALAKAWLLRQITSG